MNTVPWLRAGVGQTPAEGGCIMQVIDWIHRNEWSDSPPCVHPAIRKLAINLNDSLDDEGRQRLLDLAPRMMGTNTGGKELSVRLALFCAESVLHLWTAKYPEDDRPQKTIEATKAWVENPTTNTTHAAAFFVTYYVASTATAAANAAYAAAYAAYAASTAVAANANAASAAANAAAAYAASTAASAATNAAADAADAAYAKFDLLVGLLDEYDRITGRGSVEDLDYTAVCELMSLASASTAAR